MNQGMIYNIQRMSVHDGPGLRTTIFLKGCPLTCLWCSNPESQKTTPQMMFFEKQCTGCGICADVCPNGAVIPLDGKFGRDIEKCTHCGLCTESCSGKAREMSGKMMSVDEVMNTVRKDSLFYENSGGGVTFGGGEPTSGGEFFLEMVQAVHDEGFHVTVDTCGFCPAERFDKTIELADLFLFDCKHMDPEQHRKLTGQDNVLILRNLHAALSSGKEVHLRMPLMPNMNDSDENIAAMADFLKEFDRNEIEIMPCHAFGQSKYVALSKPLPQVSQYTPEELDIVLERFAKHGLQPVMV
ncbi:pyruvate formate lyase activating enzyme [Maridesulfovibrio ferrireducens]|uniref:Pyruvate formate lyase activating enzyme n=1 Tax=Maridesulfovibrio ferrireducens TaxID=246191 RepID=A0A1G9IXZ1_9BACT|nr:glycyl-radical enzyme activating protein [Maridesulfovibrio ferrireducens]SDL29704.1 pyruvate formate lyase activating enzyme [Maridesulfovibrio ferrireducens]